MIKPMKENSIYFVFWLFCIGTGDFGRRKELGRSNDVSESIHQMSADAVVRPLEGMRMEGAILDGSSIQV